MPEAIDNTLVNGVYSDLGEGDVDFYTHWYSICYMTAMLNVYRRVFRDIESYEQMLHRFLQSREIAFVNDSTLDVLKHIYDSWEEEIEKRGTIRVNDFIGKSKEIGLTDYLPTGIIDTDITNNSGIGILSYTTNLAGLLSTAIQLGVYHEIQFDIILVDGTGTQYDAGGILFQGTNTGLSIIKLSDKDSLGFAHYSIIYNSANNNVVFNVNVNVSILNTIKIIRNEKNVYIYVNNVLSGSSVLTTSLGFTFIRLFTNNLPIVANLQITVKDSSFNNVINYSWACNEGTGFVLESNHSPLYTAQLDIDSGLTWDSIWIRKSEFSNTDYIGLDGELRRLLDYKGGEYLNELISTSEMGLTIDVSSPISEEANCKNLNKAYEKGIVTNLSKYPLSFNALIKPVINNGYLQYTLPSDNTSQWGVNADLIANANWKAVSTYKPLGQIPFIPITIDNGTLLDGYEISFLINSDQNINLKFGLLIYDKDYNVITDSVKNYSADSLSSYFLDVDNFGLCKNRDLWIRGVYSLSKLATASNKLNIGYGTNLYNILTSGIILYMVPIISFSVANTIQTTIKLKDIVIRPLSLHSSKGLVRNKNKIISYLQNNSGQSSDYIKQFIDKKLIPYNCTNHIKFL